MSERRAIVYPGREDLVADVAERFLAAVAEAIAERGHAEVVLTGGTVGIAVLRAIGESARRVDWEAVRLWWGDERWLPSGDPERNDRQARDALLDRIRIPEAHVHAFPAADAGLGLEEAARSYAAELADAGDGAALPRFDVVFLGMGPDGHIASLFPGLPGILEEREPVLAVRDSPKPPPERLSLSRPALESAERIWLVVAGADKAQAVGNAFAGLSAEECPAGAVRGRRETVFFLDREAAAGLPAARD